MVVCSDSARFSGGHALERLLLGFWLVGSCAGLGLMACPAKASGPRRPRVHVVREGQKLGSIAKRYGVTVEALCDANHILPRDRLRVGERLIVPSGDDPVPRDRFAAADTPPSEAQHRVQPGQTLAKIAKRYAVSVGDLCAYNDLDCTRPLKAGTLLAIPGLTGARLGPAHGNPAERRTGQSHPKPASENYRRRPHRRGFVTLTGIAESWQGSVLGRTGQVLPAAREGISRVMAATGSHPRADPRLCQLIVEVSDAFGGRALRVVSGFRRESYSASSRHRSSQALDFTIPGVPNQVVRDYLLGLGDVGVGYYPHSSFVHLDVRPQHTYWVDYSGPGEPPRYRLQDRQEAVEPASDEDPSGSRSVPP